MESPQILVSIDLQTVHSDLLTVTMAVHNHSGGDIPNWELHFDLPKSIAAGRATLLLSHTGSHARIKPANGNNLLDGSTQQLQFTGHPAIIQRISDLPCGMYVSGAGANIKAAVGAHNLTQREPLPMQDDDGGVPAGFSQAQTERVLARAEHFSNAAQNDTLVLPRPSRTVPQQGAFHCANKLGYSPEPMATDAIAWLGARLQGELLLEPDPSPAAELRFERSLALPAEAYTLKIEASAITVCAGDSAGFFYAITSLLQQLPGVINGRFSLQCIELADEPRFRYRGLMLDCARHFHSKAVILRLLDLMALYKLNHFHWHLTDDEGWRIEIEAYPELTRLGAWRGCDEILEPQFGSGPDRYGGYYSRGDIREIIAYAAERQITVVPEIDIPGHSRAALKALPELLMEPEDQSVFCSAQLYNDNVLNPALPGTYEFLHKVLDEVCDLFPGPYVHIGADEVPAGVWQQSPACLALMDEMGYHNALDLQGHLLRDMQDHLAARGKLLLGWEEAAHGDKLDHGAIICAWSGISSAATTANLGYGVIACPAPFAYLDLAWDASIEEPGFHWAGTANLETCYAYEPDADELTPQGSKRLLGIQALMWSELLATPERLEYMLFPRVLAIAEIAWSPRGSKNWDAFQARVDHQRTLLEQRDFSIVPGN